MRVLRLFPLLFLAASPVSATDTEQISLEAKKELECAIWAAAVAGMTEEEGTKFAFQHAMTYWIGRFEGISNVEFDKIATAEFVSEILSRADDVQTQCLPRMQDMGARMEAWGSRLAEAKPAD